MLFYFGKSSVDAGKKGNFNNSDKINTLITNDICEKCYEEFQRLK